MEHPAALNEDFNLSTATSTTVLELAELIWRKIKGPDVPFRYVCDDPFEHDVQRRVPATDKAREVLGFEATTPLEEILDEVIPWIAKAVEDGEHLGATPLRGGSVRGRGGRSRRSGCSSTPRTPAARGPRRRWRTAGGRRRARRRPGS